LPTTRRDFTRSTNHGSVFNRTNRARVTNGKCLLPNVDGRSSWARRFRDVIAAYSSDQGGEDHLSEGRRALIRRVACLQTELEILETKFALAGGAEAGDLDLYQRASANLRRLLEAIGLDRVPRDVSSLGDILNAGLRDG
jgi:hypothetical protein